MAYDEKQRYYTQPPKVPTSATADAEKEINDESARAKATGQRPDYSKSLGDYLDARDAAKKDTDKPPQSYRRGGKVRKSGRARLHKGERMGGRC